MGAGAFCFTGVRGLPLTAPVPGRPIRGAMVVPHVRFGRSRLCLSILSLVWMFTRFRHPVLLPWATGLAVVTFEPPADHRLARAGQTGDGDHEVHVDRTDDDDPAGHRHHINARGCASARQGAVEHLSERTWRWVSEGAETATRPGAVPAPAS